MRDNASFFVNSQRHMVPHVTYVAYILGQPNVANILGQSGSLIL